MSHLKCEKGSKELQAGWPNLERLRTYLLEAVTGYMGYRQITGNSQHGLGKDKSWLPTLRAFCAAMTDSMNKGRAMLITKMLNSSGPSTDL